MGKNKFLYLPKQTQRGVALVEMLISAFILAVSIGTFLILQINSLTVSKSSTYKTQALFLSTGLLNQARANIIGLQMGAYNFKGSSDSAESNNVDCQNCSPSDLGKKDLQQWLTRVDQALPKSSVEVTFNEPILSISLFWKEHKALLVNSSCQQEQTNQSCLTIKTRVCSKDNTGSSACFI